MVLDVRSPLEEQSFPDGSRECEQDDLRHQGRNISVPRDAVRINWGATTLQRLIDLVMSGLNVEVCLVYQDDIIVFSSDVPSHLVQLRAVFSRLRAAGLKHKPSKCKVFRCRVGFLGHIVSEGGIKTDSAKIESDVT